MSEQAPPLTPLRWHYGPTATDPEPGKMWCYDCGTEVWFIEDSAICRGCGRTDDTSGADTAETEDDDDYYEFRGRW